MRKIRRRCSCGCKKITNYGKKYISGHNRRKWENPHQSLEYNSWNSMIQRCHGYGCIGYRKRGIKVCKRWRKSFDKFVRDMGYRPTKNHTIDRIDGKGNYTPKNCRWATHKEQNYNRKDNVWITYKNKTMLQKDWARELGVTQGFLWKRLHKGYSLKELMIETQTKNREVEI